jgi:hypothetical protein
LTGAKASVVETPGDDDKRDTTAIARNENLMVLAIYDG